MQPFPQPIKTLMSASQLQSLTETLTALYKRPVRVLNNYDEECVLCQLSRRPGVMDELAEIMEYRQRLPAKEKRFFPNSLYGLLCKWQEVLDRARMYEPNPQDRSHAERHLDAEIKKLCREVGME